MKRFLLMVHLQHIAQHVHTPEYGEPELWNSLGLFLISIFCLFPYSSFLLQIFLKKKRLHWSTALLSASDLILM